MANQVALVGFNGQNREPIRIRASDDFEVTGVEVEITDSRGTVLERGTAVASPNGAGWVYTTTTDLAPGTVVSIEVTATDRPGHKGTRTAQKS